MIKTSKVFLNIAAVFCFIYGAVYIFSLVFIPIGIYCFLAAKRFVYKADHINDYYSLDKKIFRNYVIFASILCFPFGLLSIIPYVILTGNNVKVKTSNSDFDNNKNNDNNIKIENIENKENDDNKSNKNVTEAKVENPESEEEKQEKFKKLQSFRKKGLITDDELEMAREQLFGKKEDK